MDCNPTRHLAVRFAENLSMACIVQAMIEAMAEFIERIS
jgi:hypothetical protein